ncbi:polysaccharide deacetylase family protein [Candidatus Saccharibacteria bacterium]|nr:polysaccharide deacetylase family protein [Candidatus Saccharibacteria bacterium]
MATGRKSAGRKIFRIVSRQKNLVVIVVAIMVGLSIKLANGSQNHMPHRTESVLALQTSVHPKHEVRPEPIKAPQVTKTPPLLLMQWRGPVEPQFVPPNAAQVVYKVSTTDPVVFVGIDDGVAQSPETLDWLTGHHLPFTMFLYNGVIKDNYQYFAKLQSAGLTVENHTLSHPQLPKLNLDQQKAEICGAADTYAQVFGRRPTLFRPPYGAFNDITRQAATECGMHAIIMWHATVDKGAMHFQDNIGHLESGDIVLMHFRPEFLQDIQVLTAQAQKDKLRIGRLEDWLK